VVLLVFLLVRAHAVQKELGRTNRQIVKLENVIGDLKMEVDASNKARTQIQSNLDQANSKIDQLRDDLDAAHLQASAELAKREKDLSDLNEQLTFERQATQSQIDTLNAAAEEAQSKLNEKQSELEAMANELANAKEAMARRRNKR
jgi:chromosome segregation ATPase